MQWLRLQRRDALSLVVALASGFAGACAESGPPVPPTVTGPLMSGSGGTSMSGGSGMGGTGTLHQLFGAAGAKFAFDTDTLRGLIDTVENTIEELQAKL